jgi:ferredoxin
MNEEERKDGQVRSPVPTVDADGRVRRGDPLCSPSGRVRSPAPTVSRRVATGSGRMSPAPTVDADGRVRRGDPLWSPSGRVRSPAPTGARLLRPSTRAFFREGRRTPGYSLFDWLHGYVYGRWPYLYIGIAVGEHPLARLFSPLVRGLSRLFAPRGGDGGGRVRRGGAPYPPTGRPGKPAHAQLSSQSPDRITFADTYHGKVVPLEAAKRLVTVEKEIRLTDLEKVIPYARARDIVLQNPDHIVVLECPCRAARPDPCQPLDVCLIVGEPFASFVAEHHPHRSRWITQDEAVEILRAERERGHVHHAFFKDAMLGRFYAICNCCACCCGAMQAHRNGTPMLASSGYVSQVDAERCVGCGACAEVCPFGAIAMDGGDGGGRVRSPAPTVDAALCMGCGVCVSRCEQGALSLVRDPGKSEPLEIDELVAGAIDAAVNA